MYVIKSVLTRFRFFIAILVGLLIGYGLTYILTSFFVNPSSPDFIDMYAFALFLTSALYFFIGGSHVYRPIPDHVGGTRHANPNRYFLVDEKVGGELKERAEGFINRAPTDISILICGGIFIITAIILYRFF